MPSALRSRVALIAFMGAFLIPITVSGLRGLTHILTCQGKVETPFAMTIHTKGPPEVTSSSRFSKGQENGLCGGLAVDLRARGDGRKVTMIILITNNTPSVWRGTVQMALEGSTTVSFPVSIGEIPAGKTARDEVEMTLQPGTTQVGGSLLIGP